MRIPCVAMPQRSFRRSPDDRLINSAHSRESGNPEGLNRKPGPRNGAPHRAGAMGTPRGDERLKAASERDHKAERYFAIASRSLSDSAFMKPGISRLLVRLPSAKLFIEVNR
jgi:hypothetical protein